MQSAAMLTLKARRHDPLRHHVYANVYDPERFERFHAQLAQLFPLVHEKLERTVIDGNLLFYWRARRTTARSCS